MYNKSIQIYVSHKSIWIFPSEKRQLKPFLIVVQKSEITLLPTVCQRMTFSVGKDVLSHFADLILSIVATISFAVLSVSSR